MRADPLSHHDRCVLQGLEMVAAGIFGRGFTPAERTMHAHCMRRADALVRAAERSRRREIAAQETAAEAA